MNSVIFFFVDILEMFVERKEKKMSIASHLNFKNV